MASGFQGNLIVKAEGFEVGTSGSGRRSGIPDRQKDIPLTEGLVAAGFEQVEILDLAPVGGVRRRASEARSLEVTVPVEPDQAAVLLIEDEDGTLAWRLPESTSNENGAWRRTASSAEHFVISFSDEDDGTQRRGVVTDWALEKLIEPVRVHVLRFAATLAIDLAIAHIEGNLKPGPIAVAGSDPRDWQACDLAAARALLPVAPRVLLLIHGTFSTTAGSFGALAGSALFSGYDLVLGLDHRTLGETPEANAVAFAEALHQLALPADAVIDAIAYSRGGLVCRCLIERELRGSPLAAQFNTVVFVGCTNGGTLLAEPKNWKALLDVYTNVLVLGARVGLAAFGASAAAPFVTEAIKTMGGFAQMLSQVAITDRHVPGLAAMEPDGALVGQLNQAIDPLPASLSYKAIATDFEPVASGSLGGRLAMGAINRIADRLYGIENDLVVPTKAMTEFGSARAANAVLTLPRSSGVYHTVYFAAPEVATQLAAWLGIEPEAMFASAEEPPMAADDAPSHPLSESADPGRRLWIDPAIPSNFERDDEMTGLGPDEEADDATSWDDRASPRPRRGFAGLGDAPPAPDMSGAHPAPPLQLDAAAPAELAERYVAAEMTPFPLLDKAANLYVTVSPDPIVVADHGAAVALDAPLRLARERPLQIEVVALHNCEVLDPQIQSVELGEADEEVLKFKVRGLAEGSAEVVVEARQNNATLASFTLRPVFVEAKPAPLRASSPLAAPPPARAGRAVLRIYEFTGGTGTRLQFNLTSDNPEIAELEMLTIENDFSIENYTAAVLKGVEDAWNLRQAGDQDAIYRGFLDRLKSASLVSTKELVPEAIRRRLWASRDQIQAIQVISSEPYIPWELMYLTNPDGGGQQDGRFFAEWGLTRWLHNAPLSRRRRPLNEGALHYVIPDYGDSGQALKGAAEERTMLQQIFPTIAPVTASSSAVRDFLANGARDCALLHFACHGQSRQDSILSSDLLMQDLVNAAGKTFSDPLTWQDVTARADFGEDSGPLVFVNACQTGAGGRGISAVAGFASAFLRPDSRRGAAAFIGALWSIDDQLANTFAATVYQRLNAGDGLEEAVAAAREGCKNGNDFTWLAYTVYGG